MNSGARLPHFHIAFDTNSLFVEAEDKLIKDSLSEFIFERNEITSPRVTWYLLDIVRAERHHQMLQVARKLVVQADKVGKLLGKDFGITQRGLANSIDSIIAEEAKRHNLKLRKLDVKQVDWATLIERSTTRNAPFEEGKTEKGFRDSVVLETFAQLVDEVSSSKAQRFVLMTNDKRLKEAIAARMSGKDYISTVDDVPTLKSMLNAFAFHIGGVELKELLEKAQQLFYREGEADSLFYEWRVEQNIRTEQNGVLLQSPSGEAPGIGIYVTASLSSVGPTTFVERIDRVVTFATYLDFSILAAIPIASSPPVYTADPYRSSNALYPGLVLSGLSPSAGTSFSGTGSFYPVAGASFATTDGPLSHSGTSALGPGVLSSAGASLGTSGFVPIAGTSVVLPASLYPSTGISSLGTTLGIPNFAYRTGRKVFEIRWRATFGSGGELKDPVLIKTSLLSTEW